MLVVICACVFLWMACGRRAVLQGTWCVLGPETRLHWPAFLLYLKGPEHTQIHDEIALRREHDHVHSS